MTLNVHPFFVCLLREEAFKYLLCFTPILIYDRGLSKRLKRDLNIIKSRTVLTRLNQMKEERKDMFQDIIVQFLNASSHVGF